MWVLGLSHHTAPIELRERAALDEEKAALLIRELLSSGAVSEAMVVSTCNRMELYFVPAPRELEVEEAEASSPNARLQADGLAVDSALDALGFSPGDVGKHVYLYEGRDAAKHFFRVAASLDSMVVGEPQILGQLKRGVARARVLGGIGPYLNRAAMRAFRVAKRIRTETLIGEGQSSIATVALELARQIFEQLEGSRVALIGTGEMGEAIARLFQQEGAKLILLGRNEARLSALGTRIGAEWRNLAELERTLTEVSVVVTSTSATLPVVGYEQVRAAMRRRRGRELFFVDVAVPRDVEEKVGGLDGVYLYNVDDLSAVVQGTRVARKDAAEQAESIVESELTEFERREEAEHVTPTVKALYSHFGRILRTEVERSLSKKLSQMGAREREALLRLTDAGTNKLLHQCSTVLRRFSVERPDELGAALELVSELFLPAPTRAESETLEAAARSSPEVGRDDELRDVIASNRPTIKEHR